MATTDAKPGFRLPWSADRSESEAPAETTGDAPIGETLTTDQEIETPDMIDAAPAPTDHMATVDDPSAVSETTPQGNEPSVSAADPAMSPEPAPSGRKPNKFMADLTKAMQGAAEAAKADTLARFGADAKVHIENIHSSTAVEAGELRKQADDDVASIREWSKAEIARIREEADERITHRKSRLEREIEANAAEIEARVQRVQRRVDAFEVEMAAFFERLLAEEDATRFAAMAQSLPEPPPFDGAPGEEPYATQASAAVTDEVPAERGVVVEPWPESPAEGVTETVDAPEAETAEEADTSADAVAEGETAAATQDETETDETDETGQTETVAVAGETEAEAQVSDPRLDALGITPDFAAAEAEAAEFTPEEGPVEEIPVIGDDALAARLAGLVPDVDAPADASLTTRVVVTGLVSVASIAGFKRQLSRVTGVQSVGVSSGPDGEFLFAVHHDAGIVLRDTITTLPGFGARVAAEAEGELTVTAKDPEAEG